MRFVVADDGMIARDRLRQYLMTFGHEVIGATDNGKRAVEMCQRLKPDAVILDIVMPQMSGDAAALAIVDGGLVPNVFVASLSTQEAIVGKLRTAGVHVLSKPYRKEQLQAELDAVLKS